MVKAIATSFQMNRALRLRSATLRTPQASEHFVTTHPNGEGASFGFFENLGSHLRQEKAEILVQYVFGGRRFHEAGMQALEQSCGQVDWPVIWIQGDTCAGTHLNSTQVHAVSGVPVRRIRRDGRVVGSVYEDRDAVYCVLGNVSSPAISLSRAVQTRQAFETMESVLGEADMDMSNVARTWIYLDDLLSWYDQFNAVRTTFFDERGVFDRMVPASTGIGASNPDHGAIVTGVLGIKSKNGRVRMKAVPSPMQCSATDYKSSFSRAVEVELSDHRRLYISGTASIDPEGATIHLGDARKQIACTMDVVKAILDSRGMTWSQTTRGIAYFKHARDVPLLSEYCLQNKVPPLPVANAHTAICRHDLLFEIEIDAIAVT